MKGRERQAAIDRAYAECGQREYVARMQAMIMVETAGKQWELRTRQFRQDYERAVSVAELWLKDAERNARSMLRAELERLGVIKGG